MHCQMAWKSNEIIDNKSYDIGTYGIFIENKQMQVFVLRPKMESNAHPYWKAQLY